MVDPHQITKHLHTYLNPTLQVFLGGKSGAQVHHLSGSQNNLSEGPGIRKQVYSRTTEFGWLMDTPFPIVCSIQTTTPSVLLVILHSVWYHPFPCFRTWIVLTRSRPRSAFRLPPPTVAGATVLEVPAHGQPALRACGRPGAPVDARGLGSAEGARMGRVRWRMPGRKRIRAEPAAVKPSTTP